MTTNTKPAPQEAQVLAKALINAGKDLGLKQSDLGAVIGKDRTVLRRGLDPYSKAGELALMLIRCYRDLFALIGGEPEKMHHWMHTLNHGVNGIPADLIKSVGGLNRVLQYLDAMRAKI